MSVEEMVLRSRDLEVVLLPELGGRLHRVRAFGRDLLRTPEDRATHRTDPFFWGAYPMAPWCNRAPAGRIGVAGRTADLHANFGDGSAIHGLVATRAWRPAADGSLVAEGGSASGWPWPFEVTLVPTVEQQSLNLEYRLRNRSDLAMPAGLGLHPWFVSPVEVMVPGARVYATNSDSPAQPAPVRRELDLRARRLPAAGLDATWTDLAVPVIELYWPELEIEARVEVGAKSLLVAVASPPAIGAVAVEPQTHGPDPLRRLDRGEPDAPAMLPPGDELRLAIRLTVRSIRAR